MHEEEDEWPEWLLPVIAIVALLFVIACVCCICRYICRGCNDGLSDSERRRRNDGMAHMDQIHKQHMAQQSQFRQQAFGVP